MAVFVFMVLGKVIRMRSQGHKPHKHSLLKVRTMTKTFMHSDLGLTRSGTKTLTILFGLTLFYLIIWL